MKNFIYLIGITSILFIGCNPKKEEILQTRPNIVFIMSDDHAYQAISAYDNSLIETPNIDREVTIEFVANRIAGAAWEFEPSVSKMTVHPGKLYSTTFFARNLLSRPITGLATPDIKPAAANKYFQKTECFCFTEQKFGASEGRDMPVRFIIDPELPEHVDTVTLSYTFYTQTELASAAR